MKNKKLKRIMTDLAAGRITKKEADNLMKGEKVPQIKPNKQFKGKNVELNEKGGKIKSHKII